MVAHRHPGDQALRAREFMREDATTAGNIATVVQPLGVMITRQYPHDHNKYRNAVTQPQKRKKHAQR